MLDNTLCFILHSYNDLCDTYFTGGERCSLEMLSEMPQMSWSLRESHSLDSSWLSHWSTAVCLLSETCFVKPQEHRLCMLDPRVM